MSSTSTRSRKAPGRYYRRGISLPELFAKFPDDAAAEAWFVEKRWPDGIRCPACGSNNIADRKNRRPQPWRCRTCRRDFSVKTGTVMHDSKLGLRLWALAIYLMSTSIKGVSSMKLHRDLGVTQKTAWFLAHRIRHAFNAPGTEPFLGPVETDETYIGGKERNKHARKKLHDRHPEGKTPVIGMRDRRSGRIAAEPVDHPHPNSADAREFIARHAHPRALVYTDDSRIYDRLPRRRSVAHGVGQYVDGQAHTNSIESFWALFKRGYIGVYHHMSPKHLHRYVDEFTGRHNIRPLDTAHQMALIAAALDGRRLTYRQLTAE